MCEIADWVMLILLGGCSISDWKKKEIPLYLLIIFSIVVGISLFVCRSESVLSRVGGAAIGLLLFAISKCTKEAVGYGDSWVILLLGIYLGGLQILQVLFVASLAAGVCSLFFLWKARWKRNTTLPFIPFLAAAYLGVMFV